MLKPVRSENWQGGLNKAVTWLRSHPGKKILIEQNRNLGDTLHLIPIIRHYRILHPKAKIAFLTAHPYTGAHVLNPNIDKLFSVPKLNPQERIKLRKKMVSHNDITVIAPSIFPYGSVWPKLAWSYPNIADQYFCNSGIADLEPKGGRRLKVGVTPDDAEWAKKFIQRNNLRGKFLCSLEYISYSHSPFWKPSHFRKFVARLNEHNVKCISFAGPKENPIAGSVNACGVSWRRTVALMEHIHVHVGIGSGMTMLAASAENQPKILEILVPDSITMKGCQYAPSIAIKNKNPQDVADHVWFKVLH